MADTLASLRQSIDQVDEEIMRLLSLRQELVERVAGFKAGPREVVDSHREEEILTRIQARARAYNLDPDLLVQIYRLIFQGAVARQQQLLGE